MFLLPPIVIVVISVSLEVQAALRPLSQSTLPAPFFIPRFRREVPDNAYVEGLREGPPFSTTFGTTPVPILKQTDESNVDGSFKYGFESGNGIVVEASGYQKPISSEETAQVMQGQYSYLAPGGTFITVKWRADENGFHAGLTSRLFPPPPFQSSTYNKKK